MFCYCQTYCHSASGYEARLTNVLLTAKLLSLYIGSEQEILIVILKMNRLN